MTLYTAFSILICLTAFFAYINNRFVKLPATIGLMVLALISSFVLIGIGIVNPAILEKATTYLRHFNFSELLMGSMLSFMLFAGAIHIKLEQLKQEKIPVIVFSTFSVLLSTFIIGIVTYYLLGLFNIQTNLIYCLLFGSLISPTDPIAVLAILKEAKISPSLEMTIAGESLFNDGVAVVIFLTILQVAEQSNSIHFTGIILLFAQEAIGGILFGIIIGYLGLMLMREIDDYKVEVLITLALVMGGYSLANFLHTSGPLAMVAAGIIIGNQGKEHAKSKKSSEYIYTFWELLDEILNAILFVLMGLELLIIHFVPVYIVIGLLMIVLVLATRYISVFLPSQFIKFKEKITQRTLVILTWGGLRGGISIALALSLQPEMQKDLWVILTYCVVTFSILVQGLTIGKLARKKSI
ncbi:MAG: sodium:proton antiporter [Bacteroidia bacterium]